MIHVITGANRHLYEPELLAHFRLRHEIYVAERNWANLARPDGLERDQFDNEDATYVLASENGQIIGGSRLVPTTRPHLLSEVFPYLAAVRGLPRAADIYEWTRMFVVKSRREGRTMGGQTRGMVICGVLEHCNGITSLTALIEMFWLPLFHSMGWTLIPLGLPELINGEWSIAVRMPIDENNPCLDTRVSCRRRSRARHRTAEIGYRDYCVTEIVQKNIRPMPTDKAQLVRYIRDLGREMAKLANDANDASLDLLAYLLSLVVLEAESLNASELVAGPDDSPPQD